MSSFVCSGAVVGMPRPRSWAKVVRSARLVIGTTLVTTVTDPLHRPIAWLSALLVVTCSATALLVSFTWSALLVGAVAGAAGMAVLVVVVGGVAELVTAVRADRLWHHYDPTTGRVQATGLTVRTRAGDWTLKSVAAWPFRTGAGSELVAAVCRDADRAGVTVHLESSTPRVTRFYRRHGFTPGRRSLSGGHTMARAPIATEPGRVAAP